MQYDVATEPGMRSVIEKSTRDGETPQLGWGSNCSWEFNNHVIPLIDGNSAFSSMAKAIRDAKSCVYIAGWSITLGLPMERDKYGGNTTLGDLLIRCADRGVDVYLMAWRGSALSVGSELLEPWKTSLSDKHRKHIFIATPTNPEMGKMKDVSSMSHHQKIVVIDDMCAFIGGLDVTTNRWDLNSHPCLARLSENARLRSKKSASLMVKLNMDSRFTGFDYYSPSLDDLDAHTFLKKFKVCYFSPVDFFIGTD